jgi:hypothetical protein
MEKLEDFIRKNREDLDRYNPSPNLWKRINTDLGNKKPSFNRWLSIAAMIVVILSTGVFILRIGRTRTGNEPEMVSADQNSQLNPHLKETEIYYNNLVNSLYREATPLLTGNPEIKKELTTDISQLDSICSEIKKDLKDNVANQEVVEALIQNYRIKIRLLEDMLVILKENETKQEKNKSHEL